MIYLGDTPVGVAKKVDTGGITAYQKATVSYANGDITTGGMYLNFNHNLGVVPKFVIVKEADGETATAGNYEYYSAGEVCGGSQITNASTGNKSRYIVYRVETVSSNGTYSFSSTSVSLRQNANTTHFDTGINYTIELWG